MPLIHLDQPSRTNKDWGWEDLIVNTPQYCGKEMHVMPNGMASSIHFHKNKIETLHILKGELCLELWMPRAQDAFVTCAPEAFELMAAFRLHLGQAITLFPQQPHRFWSLDRETVFAEWSTRDEPSDSYRIVKSGLAPVFTPKEPPYKGMITDTSRDVPSGVWSQEL